MEVGEGKVTEKEKDLQWHPAFFASIQIELAKEAHKLIFENEHTLSTKPMLIDVVIIKKNSDKSCQSFQKKYSFLFACIQMFFCL